MTISVQIHPSTSSIAMYNDLDVVSLHRSAYSLSGHVSVSLSSSPSSYFGKGRTMRAVLRSLVITFEGQQELVTAETGYSATRLCIISKELAPSSGLLLTNDGQDGKNDPCVWKFIFDLPIPGWMPGTSVFGNDQHGPAGTSYALYAEALLAPIEDSPSRSWPISSLCSALSPKERLIRAPKQDIRIIRYTVPTVTTPEGVLTFPDVSYLIETHCDKNIAHDCIPGDILNKVEVLASVPEVVSVDEGSIKLIVRLRASHLTEDQQKRLRLKEFEVDVRQGEGFHKRPPAAYKCSFPLPPEELQPERKPLLNPHSLKSLYDIGILSTNTEHGKLDIVKDGFSLLPPKHVGPHPMSGNGIPFASEAHKEGATAWCKLEVSIPFLQIEVGEDREWERRHAKVKAIRPSEVTPLHTVVHDLYVELGVVYDSVNEGEAPATERLAFTLPLTFAHVPPFGSVVPPLLRTSESPKSPPALGSFPDVNSLPAYSQLYLPNGDRRIDYAVPLPAYSPRESDVEVQSQLQGGEKA